MGFNRQKGLSTVAVIALFAVFSAVAFLSSFQHSLTFWIGYGFTALAAVVLILCFMCLLSAPNAKKRFLGLSVISLGWIYMAVQIVLGLLQISGVMSAYLPSLIIDTCVAFLFIILLLVLQYTGQSIAKQDEHVAEKVLFIKNMDSLVGSIKTDDETLRCSLEKLQENFRFSDPMSHSSLGSLEKQIEEAVQTLKSEISDVDKSSKSIEDIENMLDERNRQCRLLKDTSDEVAVKDNSGAKYVGAVIGVFAFVAAIVLLVIYIAIPNSQYNDGMELYNNGQYAEAIAVFENLDSYRKSEEMITSARDNMVGDTYELAESYFNEQKYAEALAIYTELGDYEDSVQKVETIYNRLAEGDILYYGTYNNAPIAWQVLSNEEDSMLLISADAICLLPYDDNIKNATWETSTISAWLNNEFLESFTDEQMSSIIDTKIDGDKYKVFLLSQDEYEDYKDSGKLSIGTQYWLCTVADDATNAMVVNEYGEIEEDGDSIVHSNGIRPCIWLDLQ